MLRSAARLVQDKEDRHGAAVSTAFVRSGSQPISQGEIQGSARLRCVQAGYAPRARLSTLSAKRFLGRDSLPLVVMLHGCRQDSLSFCQGYAHERAGRRRRFAVLYPEQSKHANPLRCWNWFDSASLAGQGEAALIARLIDQSRAPSIDPRRVHVVGMSAGGAMACILGRAPQSPICRVRHSFRHDVRRCRFGDAKRSPRWGPVRRPRPSTRRGDSSVRRANRRSRCRRS